jgi:CubicO group peptidase (beta-lactamase class C family)
MGKSGLAPQTYVNRKLLQPLGRRVVAALGAFVALVIVVSLCATASELPATASTPGVSAATWRSFGRWLGSRAAAGEFSGAALVAKDGRVLLDAGYGMANRRTHVADTARTKFTIASIGKLFTAVAIAQLVEQHKLSFDDTIGKYLAGFAPAVADHVTIAELLDMTSGLGNVALSNANSPTTIPGMLRQIENEPVQFTPGSRFLYSNDGYIVLGAIIERVSGQGYGRYLDEHIFKPAGMTHTDVNVYSPAHVPGMAHGYMLVGSNGQPVSSGPPPAAGQASNPQAETWEDNSNRPQVANPSGGAYSTVSDLLDFAKALLDHKLLSPTMTQTVLTPRVDAPQPGGPPVDDYTYGFAYQAIDGVAFVGHNGGTPGYGGQIDIYPKTDYVVVILTNQDQALVPAIQRSEALLTGSGS